MKARMEPGTAVGALCAQSIGNLSIIFRIEGTEHTVYEIFHSLNVINRGSWILNPFQIELFLSNIFQLLIVALSSSLCTV